MNISRIVTFFKNDIWKMKTDEGAPVKSFFIVLLKKLVLAVDFFTTKRVMDMAAALTYSTLLAIVPICAVVFAIARGFGYSKYIEVWFRDAFSSQPDRKSVV